MSTHSFAVSFSLRESLRAVRLRIVASACTDCAVNWVLVCRHVRLGCRDYGSARSRILREFSPQQLLIAADAIKMLFIYISCKLEVYSLFLGVKGLSPEVESGIQGADH